MTNMVVEAAAAALEAPAPAPREDCGLQIKTLSTVHEEKFFSRKIQATCQCVQGTSAWQLQCSCGQCPHDKKVVGTQWKSD